MSKVIDFSKEKQRLAFKKKIEEKVEMLRALHGDDGYNQEEIERLTRLIDAEEAKETDGFDFESIMKQNNLKKEKLNKERSKSNDQVKRSYKIKGK